MFETSIEAYILAKNRLKSQNLKMVKKTKTDRFKLFELKKLLKNAISKYK